MKIVNDLDQFFEMDEELFVFGAGSFGYWIGYYLDRCGIDYCGYIDRAADDMTGETPCYGKRAVSLKAFRGEDGKQIRVIIGMTDYQAAVFELVKAENDYGISVICVVNEYYDRYYKTYRCNINKFLSYFRRKLVVNDRVSIVANSCFGSITYSLLGIPAMSPTIDFGICAEEYIRLCENPEYYFSKELTDFQMGRQFIAYNNFQSNGMWCKCGDIRLYCGHDVKQEYIVNRWDYLRKRVNYDNMAWILTDLMDRIDHEVLERFRKLSGRKMIVTTRVPVEAEGIDSYFVPEIYEYWKKPYEFWMDLVEWINR